MKKAVKGLFSGAKKQAKKTVKEIQRRRKVRMRGIKAGAPAAY